MLYFVSYPRKMNATTMNTILVPRRLKFGAIIIGMLSYSCASHNYSIAERMSDQSVKFQSNVPSVSVRFQSTIGSPDVRFEPNRSSGTLFLPGMRKKYLTLVFSAPDYNPEIVHLKRRIRGRALVKSLALSTITFGTPLLIDVFRSDFYELNPKSRNVRVNLKFSDDFYKRQFDAISGTTNIPLVREYVWKYPLSPFRPQAIRLRDALEFQQARTVGTEDALKEFISTHSASHNVEDAKYALSQMVEARIAFEQAMKDYSVDAFSAFINTFPASLHVNDAKAARVKIAFEDALLAETANEDEVASFLKDYGPDFIFIPEIQWTQSALTTCINRFMHSLESYRDSTCDEEIVCKSIELSKIDDLLEIASRSLASDNQDFFEHAIAPEKQEIQNWVYDYFYDQGINNKLNGGWEGCIENFQKLFPTLCDGDFECFMETISQQTEKNAEIKLTNPKWVSGYFEAIPENNILHDLCYYSAGGRFYRLEEFTNQLILHFSDNNLTELVTIFNGDTTAQLSFQKKKNSGDMTLVLGEYFQNNELILRTGFEPITSSEVLGGQQHQYYHEFRGGRNMTLESHPTIILVHQLFDYSFHDLDDRIDEVEKALKELKDLSQRFPIQHLRALPNWDRNLLFLQNRINEYNEQKEKKAQLERQKQEEFERQFERQRLATTNFTEVRIGSQVWMSADLQVRFFGNGDPIQQSHSRQDWISFHDQQKPAWMWGNWEEGYGEVLYNYHAIVDDRGLCPVGWHVPSGEEWKTLKTFLGENAGYKLKDEKAWGNYRRHHRVPCTNCASWNSEYRRKVACGVCKDTRDLGGLRTFSANGSDIYGFSARPNNNGGDADWWSTDWVIGEYAFQGKTRLYTYYRVDYDQNALLDKSAAEINGFLVGHRVRCIKD
jgi:uncharacterized protein (TIGR02145 family)